MTEQLAEELANLLRPLPFATRVVGLARPVDTNTADTFEDEKARRIKTPVAVNYPPDTEECVRDERFLLPDQQTPGIFFFEDRGTTRYAIAPGISGYESTLQLLGWLNAPLLKEEAPSENTVIDALWKALGIGKRLRFPEYNVLSLQATILPAEAVLFSKYTYAAELNPMLYPPYRLIGLELRVRYLYVPVCVPAEPIAYGSTFDALFPIVLA